MRCTCETYGPNWRLECTHPLRCLEIVHRVVPQLYKINHELLLNELSESLDAMSKKSRSVEDFANLIVQYR